MQDMQAGPGELGPDNSAAQVSAEEHTMLVQYFEDSEEARRDDRELSFRCRDYYDSKQLTSEQRHVLEVVRKQPPVVMNKIAPKVNFLIGLEVQQRTDPKAAPRTPQHEEDAEAATDALRYVEERERLDFLTTANYEDMLIEGECGIEINVKQVHDVKTGQPKTEIDIKLWRFDRLFADPHSTRHDYSDARYKGGVLWMDEEQAAAKWPDCKDKIEFAFNEASDDQHYDDKPGWQQWVSSDSKRKRIRVVQIYYQMGNTWKWAIYCKGGVLEGGEVPFKNSDGETECPLEMQACYIDRNNGRYGVVKALLDPQDEINKRRSKMLHLLSLRQFKIQPGGVDDIDKTRSELAKPDGVIEENFPGAVEILPTVDMAQGHAQLLQQAQAEMDEMGANNALRGVTGNQASGRAIQASQQGGQLEIGVVQDRYRDFKLRVYRQIWNRIRQYWTDERWVRVTDNEQNAKFAQLNKPVTLKEKIAEEVDAQAEEMREQGAPPEQIEQFLQQKADEVNQQFQMNPEALEQQVEVKNQPAQMDMDIIIDTAPDSMLIQQEQFEELTKILGSGMELQDPRMKLLISASQLRGKKELLKQIDDAQKENPMQQQAQQLQLESGKTELEAMKAELRETMAKVEKLAAETDKIRSETSNTEMNTAATELEIVDGVMQPEQQNLY